ncbi:hypothetical protein PIB30_042943 [Stylosanthes scabra]|uniref:Uncharacterized protein n=1 Tax=Stylosanthes scabra TaxID=79078 RepID=A0ABU6YE12_9FABA|nr:hypothetical protein [Stylosanthes scabra]
MRNCPLITEIWMENTGVGKQKVEEDCLVVNSHVKFLYLAHNTRLGDGSVAMLASVCPNLEMMDFRYCGGISMDAIEVLWRCCKIQKMNLAQSGYFLCHFQFRVNFKVPTLLVLNLSTLCISHEERSHISKICYNLKELNLDFCDKITASGVLQVVKNCKQLRMISLWSSKNVSSDIIYWMVSTRPSLREIITPRTNPLTVGERDDSLRHGWCVDLDNKI